MSLHHAAQHLAAQGRGPDTTLVHMTPGEVRGLQQIAMANGGSLTINPQTGLPEAGFLSSILPTLGGAALTVMSGGAINPLTAGLIMGGIQTARTGSLQKGLMAGLGAYGGAGLGSGLMGAGASAAQTTANQAIAAGPEFAGLQPTASLPGAFGEAAGSSVPTFASEGARQTALTGAQNTLASPTSSMMAGVKGLGTEAGRTAFMQNMGGGSGLLRAGLSAAAPALAETTKQPEIKTDNTPADKMVYNPGRPMDASGQPITPMPDVPDYGPGLGQDFGRQQSFFPNAGYTTPVIGQKRYAAGGMPVEEMSKANALGMNTGYPQADITGHAYATASQTPISQNVVQGTADTGVNRMTGQMLAGGGITGNGNLNLNIPLDFGDGQVGFGGGANGYQAVGSGGQGGFAGLNNTAGEGFGAPINPFKAIPNYGLTEEQKAYNRSMAFPARGQNNPSINSTTTADMTGGVSNPMQASEAMKALKSLLNGQPQQNTSLQMATGGLAAYAAGGASHLGDYSDGGRLLRGPGDGVSDSIPAVIGKRQPARLADGEFVVPARIVSELGNGSTEAGARKLYAMMDRVQSARKKTVGKRKIAHNSRADRFLPA